MKNTILFTFALLVSLTLTAQIEKDSIVIVETEVYNTDTFSCEQWANHHYELKNKYYYEENKAQTLAYQMSKKVSPCYFYTVEVKVKKIFKDKSNCSFGVSSHSFYPQDYTFYIIKKRANPLYAQKSSGSTICNYDIHNLPDNR